MKVCTVVSDGWHTRAAFPQKLEQTRLQRE